MNKNLHKARSKIKKRKQGAPLIEIKLWNGKIIRTKLTRSKAIKFHCQQCIQAVSARKCFNQSCSLFVYRPGKPKQVLGSHPLDENKFDERSIQNVKDKLRI